MTKKLFLSFILLTLLVGGIIATTVVSRRSLEMRSKAAPATTLALKPSTTTPGVNQTFTVDVAIDTGSNAVVITELYLAFDKTRLHVEDIVAGSFLTGAETRGKNFDNTNGTAALTIYLPTTLTPKSGKGILAKVTFRALAIGTTTVSMAPATLIGAIGEQGKNVLTGPPSPTTITIREHFPDTTLSLQPTNTTASLNQVITIPLVIDTGTNKIVSSDLTVTFDPQKLKAQDITAGSFFTAPQTRGKVVNNTEGKAGLTVFVSTDAQPQMGKGTLALATFQVIGTGTTTLGFSSDTVVAALNLAGYNALESATGVTLTLTTSVPSITPTKIPTVTPKPTVTPTPPSLHGDINADGKVNALDYTILFENFGKHPFPHPHADINGDGKVNALDYTILFENFGTRSP